MDVSVFYKYLSYSRGNFQLGSENNRVNNKCQVSNDSLCHVDQSQSHQLTFNEDSLNLLFLNNSLNSDKLKLLQYIDNNIIGKNYIIHGPWGPRRCRTSFIYFFVVMKRFL